MLCQRRPAKCYVSSQAETLKYLEISQRVTLDFTNLGEFIQPGQRITEMWYNGISDQKSLFSLGCF